MRFYEIAYLISTKIEPEKVKETQKEIISLVRKHEGEIEEETPPLKRTLAYPIKKEKEAFLVSLTFWMSPSKIKDFKKDVDKIKEILRYLIVIVKKKAPKKVPEIEKKKPTKKPEKVELEKLEEKLEEILGTKL